ncbi:IS3 family transposase [Peribacillus loiseleuriae]|uniref:IS3 family transposase n=1 Tax=Peribacillus loiseleuriae TaxID=1679170 RepID=UPI003D067A58
MKSEKSYLKKYETYEALEKAIQLYIDFYNHQWYQKRLNGLTCFYYFHCLLDRVQFTTRLIFLIQLF